MFFFGVRRGGSSIAFQLLDRLCFYSQKLSSDIVAKLHADGVELRNISAQHLEDATKAYDIIGCFRDSSTEISRVVRNSKAVLLMRDPRDCILSWFHAQHLHVNDVTSPPVIYNDLMEYLSHGDDLLEQLDRIHDSLDGIEHIVVQYDDLAYRPRFFLEKLISFCDIRPSRHGLDEVLTLSATTQILPDNRSHNRTGLSGAALHELSSEALSIINTKYKYYLNLYGYHLNVAELETSRDTIDRQEFDSLKRFIMILSQENGYRIAEINRLRKFLEEVKAGPKNNL